MISMRIEPWQAILAIVLVSFTTVALEFPHGPWLATAPISLACGVAALALMASAAILSARWPLLEEAFGGLDRMYDAHKWLGISALSLARGRFAATLPLVRLRDYPPLLRKER